jgi:hypothetical protein
MKIFAILLIVFAFGCAPRDESPGTRLGGSDAASPTDFAFVQDTEVIQLEAQGMLIPRVVNIWAVGFDNAMYVWSDPGSGWSQRVHKRPDEVRVRIGDRVYKVSATEVSDASEMERVGAAFQTKYADEINELYGRPMTTEDFELLFRLVARD